MCFAKAAGVHVYIQEGGVYSASNTEFFILVKLISQIINVAWTETWNIWQLHKPDNQGTQCSLLQFTLTENVDSYWPFI